MNKTVFPERESKLIEFKSSLPKFDALIKTSVAFANGAGGRLIIGIDDVSHEVIGVNDDDRARLYDDFPNSLYDSTQPSLVAQIYEQSFNKKSVIIIEIPASPKKPYFIKNKGVANGTYIRVGSSTRKATADYIEDLTREAQRINFDEEAVLRATVSDLSGDLLKEYFVGKTTKKRLLADQIITNKTANKEEFCPTVAGVLMFCESPDQYITEAVIKCTQFNGITGRDILRTEDIAGTIEHQAEKSFTVLNAWLQIQHKIHGVKRRQELLVPADALREALLNALLHRKYTIPGAVKIALYDNRLEIFSPGGFPGPVDINTIGDGTTYLRNPNIVRIAYKSHLIETRGTGIRLMIESCKKAGLKQPEFHEEGDFVKVIFYFEPDINAYDNEDEAILIFIEQQRAITAQQLAQYLGVSHNTAIRKLKSLITENKVKKIGKGPAVKYVR